MAVPYKGLPDPIQLAQGAATANRVNSVTPTGSGTWSPGVNGGPATYTESLNPALQGALNTQNKTYGRAVRNAGGVLSNPTLDFSKIPGMTVNPGQTGQDAIMSRLSPQIERERSALHTQLVNWGLQPGTQAYNEAMARQGEQENDLLSRAAIGGISLDTEAHRQGVSDQQAAIQTPLNAINTMAGRSEAPYSPGSGIAGSTPDTMGAWNAMNNANIASKNNSQQSTTDWLNFAMNGVKAAPDVYDWLKTVWP